MEYLDEVLADKKIEDLEPAVPKPAVSNIITPTKAELESIVALMVAGKTDWEIKREFRREVTTQSGKSYPGFTPGQLAEVRSAIEAKIAELKAAEKPPVIPK